MPADSRLIVCPNCQAVNRVHAGREDEAVCGKCRSRVLTPVPLELIGSTFDKHVSRTELPVVVDFYSPTCGPCLMMGPQFQEAAKSLFPEVRLAKLDTSAGDNRTTFWTSWTPWATGTTGWPSPTAPCQRISTVGHLLRQAVRRIRPGAPRGHGARGRAQGPGSARPALTFPIRPDFP